MPDYEERAVNGPPEFFPAGKVYTHRGGHSTHLNIIVEAPQGGYMLTPLLVPGQKDVGKLLRGDRPSDEQVQIAQDYAHRRGPIGTYGTLDEARAGEREWRTRTVPHIEDYIKKLDAEGAGPP